MSPLKLLPTIRRAKGLAAALGLAPALAAGLAGVIGLGAAALPQQALAAGDDGWFSAIDAARGDAKKAGPHVAVEIVSEMNALTPQAENRLAVRFTHEPGWHTYWKMPGDAGFPPEFTFSAPSSLKISKPLFPLPERTVTSGLTTFGYGGVTHFPFKIELPRGTSGRAVVSLHVEYLACRDMCVPESADVRVTLPIDVAGKPTADAEAVAQAVQAVPERVSNDGAFTARIDGDRIRIDVAGNAAVARSLDFMPSEKGVIRLSEAPVTALSVAPEGGAAEGPTGSSLWLAADGNFAKAPAARLSGILVADGGPAAGGWAVETDIPLAAGTVTPPPETAKAAPAPAAAAAAPAVPAPADAEVTAGTGAALLFAFLGGLILNLMPCVFPVLSLKLLDLIHGARRSESLLRHGFAFAGGVLLSMALLSGTLIGLRAAGHAVGWGFQLQQPWVVGALILLFGAIACNLLGLYEVTFGSGAADAKIVRNASRSGAVSSFLSGILAVVVASPCTAPFMGAGIGYALTQPALEAILVFMSLGLGMAAPWVVLCIFPGWAKWLPKPGGWMVTFRKVMAVPMVLAVVWLGWVLSKQIDYRGVLVVLCGLAAVAVFCWLLGRRQFGRSSNVVVMAMMAAIAVGAVAVAGSGAFERRSTSTAEGWENWSPAAVQSALAEGRPVFVDFTAAWCITCQANKLAALDRDEVVERMNRLGYVRLIADWTNKDPAITEALAAFGRTGVPLYVIYRPDGSVAVLPELLTADVVLGALGE